MEPREKTLEPRGKTLGPGEKALEPGEKALEPKIFGPKREKASGPSEKKLGAE